MSNKSKIEQAADAVVNTSSNLLDKVSSPASRAGITIDRVAKMAKAGVVKTAIAAQLSSGSATGHEYSETEVDTLVRLHQDCTTRVPLTRSAASALIDDATANGTANTTVNVSVDESTQSE